MIIEIRIPSPGESITEVELANWLVNDGDFVEKDQEIAEIESDKATLPLIAEESGIIKIRINTGQTARIGDVACEIDTQKLQERESKTGINSKDTKTKTKKSDKIKITPLAEKMMTENNLNIEDIINGLKKISSKEVQMILRSKIDSTVSNDEIGTRNEERQAISKLRKKLSDRLMAVKNETAMLTTFNEVNMGQVIELRKKYQKEFTEKHGIKLGFMSFFVKAAVESLKSFPKVNSRFKGDEIISPQYYDIGIAVQTDKGLMVPVLRNAETMTLSDIEHKISELAQKARINRISIEEISGGTFSITNGGVFGSLLSTPILNPPQSAILGMHNIVDRPVAVNRKVEIHPMMYLALSYDHRMIDGKDSVSFLLKIKEYIESPYMMLFNGKNPESVLLDL